MTRSQKFKTEPLTDNQMVLFIRQTPALNKVWSDLQPDQRRWALADAGGDLWHIDMILEDAKEVVIQ